MSSHSTWPERLFSLPVFFRASHTTSPRPHFDHSFILSASEFSPANRHLNDSRISNRLGVDEAPRTPRLWITVSGRAAMTPGASKGPGPSDQTCWELRWTDVFRTNWASATVSAASILESCFALSLLRPAGDDNSGFRLTGSVSICTILDVEITVTLASDPDYINAPSDLKWALGESFSKRATEVPVGPLFRHTKTMLKEL
ncbi:hypothetical protein BU26DRAFT_560897 [Trematosphaeria pertusa]|uniref:Uncharacterized protein n=1 Tax=Trematosphaeria pertusa TaxID=390896 RepID=A0A6A6IVG8_9PLEO|nr:uncharacterized protein BU26DRAFT_560897 [Trematosphaeria pertusa]KAF2253610.1 hypothetical protein BU26DRAFT_560897 [Trematosphaeria pertusa]